MVFRYISPLQNIRVTQVSDFGGKNSSLGEMLSQLSASGIRVPGGFATKAGAFTDFLESNRLDQEIAKILANGSIEKLENLSRASKQIKELIRSTDFPESFKSEIKQALDAEVSGSKESLTFAVRSSATAEDLVDASFAGQQESFLNISGFENILAKIKEVYASLYNERAISYRVHKGFKHEEVAISVAVQRMVRSDLASSGVMFTIDTESGFDQVVFITSGYGLGEALVQGSINPDEFYVYKSALAAGRPAILRRELGSKEHKMIYADQSNSAHFVQTVAVAREQQIRFSLTDAQVEELARFAVIIEKHYGRPMDIEWALDGKDGQLYILQARPETVNSAKKVTSIQRFRLKSKSELLITGRAIGQKIGAGPVANVKSAQDIQAVKDGDVLVTDMTDPDWEPIMKRASAIVTNRGGRTCHAAIIARELGVPAVVGCGNATELLATGEMVTVSCAEGETGMVYKGKLEIETNHLNLAEMPQCPVKITMNVANPEMAFEFQKIPNFGVGLLRIEFIIARSIGLHPRAALGYEQLPSELRDRVREKTAAYGNPVDYYTERLVEGISTIAAAFFPKPVIVRMSDFKSNEYSALLGGDLFEPKEENPMIGFRGAGRYVSPMFADCFELECRAIKKIREKMGLTNVEVMIPFVRTLSEAKRVITTLENNGLKRGQNGLKLIMMCEIPSNAILADQFLELFDGFSIGSNDMTQLTLAIDRDSGIVAESFDERDAAVKAMLSMAIQACRKKGKYIGICGQGPSDHPDFAQWLMEQGIESLSLNPDTVVDTWLYLAKCAPGSVKSNVINA